MPDFRFLTVIGCLFGAALAFASPVIQSTPEPRQIVMTGRSLSLNVTATGSGSLSYQWWRSGRPIPGATSASYTFTNARVWKDAGWYEVVVTDGSGSSISAPIFVNVAIAPHTILTWGLDDWGHQPGEMVERNLPETAGVTGLAVGGYYAGDFMLALRDDGTVNAWGFSAFAVTKVPAGLDNVVAVAAGSGAVALKADGTVVTWGFQETFATELAAAAKNLTGVVGVACPAYPYSGGAPVAALRADGTVLLLVMKGASNYYEVTPKVWPGLSDAVAICAGGNFIAALRADGTVAISYEGLANGPVAGAVNGLTDVVAISAAYDSIVALKADGTVATWGNNSKGQITVPADLREVVAVAAGPNGSTMLALKADGTVTAWGYPDIEATVVPANAKEVSLIASGAYFSIAARTQTESIANPPPAPPTGISTSPGSSGTGSTGGSTSAPSTATGSTASGGGGAVSPWFLMSVLLVWLVRLRQQVRGRAEAVENQG